MKEGLRRAVVTRNENGNAKTEEWKPVAQVQHIFIYPFKSGKAISVNEAMVNSQGIKSPNLVIIVLTISYRLRDMVSRMANYGTDRLWPRIKTENLSPAGDILN